MAQADKIPECPKCGGRSWLATSIGVMCKQCQYIQEETETPKLPLVKEDKDKH